MMRSARLVIVCDMALHEKNGAGMRAIMPYLQDHTTFSILSLFLFDGRMAKEDVLKDVQYEQVDYTYQENPFSLLPLFFRTCVKLLTSFKRNDHFIVLPNTIQDVVMGLCCRLFGKKITIWVMDDFIAVYAGSGRLKKYLYKTLFSFLYKIATRRIVVSHSMADVYRKRYKINAEFILGRTLATIHSPPPPAPWRILRDRKKIRIVYIGSFLSHYIGPMKILKEILGAINAPLPLDLEVDLYGMQPPDESWLLAGKIQYRGPVEPERLLDVLRAYDFGLVTYSFDEHTERMMSVSFPSKLIDYLGASLPSLIIAPATLSFIQEATQKQIGYIQSELSVESVLHLISKIALTTNATYQEWQLNAFTWAKEEYLMNRNQVKKILDFSDRVDTF